MGYRVVTSARCSSLATARPAAAGIVAFAWLELVAPDRATVVVVQSWLALYVVIMGFGAVLFGQAWFAAADPFEVYATLMAKLSPWGRRRSDGAIVVRTVGRAARSSATTSRRSWGLPLKR